MKVCVPELAAVAALAGRADFAAEMEGLALAARTGVTEIVGVAEVPAPAGILDFADAEGTTAAEALEAGADAAADELGPVPAHAVRPAKTATAMLTAAGTRDILIRSPSGKQSVATKVTAAAWLPKVGVGRCSPG